MRTNKSVQVEKSMFSMFSCMCASEIRGYLPRGVHFFKTCSLTSFNCNMNWKDLFIRLLGRKQTLPQALVCQILLSQVMVV